MALLALAAWAAGSTTLAAVGALAVAAVVLFTADLAWLPSLGLAAFVLVPLESVPAATQNGAYSPALLVIGVLALRAFRMRAIASGLHVVPTICLTGWVLVATFLSSFPTTSLAWSVNLVILVGVPSLLLPGWSEATKRLEQTWLGLGGVLGTYAVVELLLQRNPLFPYTNLEASGSFRLTTTLGQPLVNGTFFALAALFGVARLIRGDRGWVLIATLLATIGVFGTASRGALAALVVGSTLVVLLAVGRAQIRITRRGLLLVLTVASLFAAGALASISERSVSGDLEGSTLVRQDTYQSGLTLAREYWPVGAGPGLADILKRSMPEGDPRRGVEASFLQLAISLGLPGVLFAAWLTLAAGARAVRRRPDVACGLAAYVVSAGTYNLIEANRPALLLWGILIGMAASGGPGPASRSHPASSVAPGGTGRSMGGRLVNRLAVSR